jgi:hypothetical protein
LTREADCGSPYFFESDLQQRLRTEDEDFVLQFCSFMALSQDSTTGLYKWDESFCVDHPSGRPVYLFRGFSVTANPTVSSPVQTGLTEQLMSASDEIAKSQAVAPAIVDTDPEWLDEFFEYLGEVLQALRDRQDEQ